MVTEVDMPMRRALFSAMFSRRSAPSTTAGFRAKRHNSNLCPELQERVDEVAALFRRHFGATYDIQGFRDRGIDVILRIGTDAEASYIGFQVKANDERGPDLYRTLKAQHSEALGTYKPLLDYYIVLCWDQKDSINEVRLVASDFQGHDNVHVIEPVYAWNFLYELSTRDIEATVRSQVADNDPLVDDAREYFLYLSPSQAALLVAAVVQATDPSSPEIRRDDLAASSLVQRAYLFTSSLGLGYDREFPAAIAVPPGLDTRLGGTIDEIPYPEDMATLDSFISEDYEGVLTLERTGAEAVLALAYEARARLKLEGRELEEYLYALTVAELPKQIEGVSGRDLAELAIIIGTSDMDPEKMVGLLAVLLRNNVSSAWECLNLLNATGDFDESELALDPDPFGAVAEWMIDELGDGYYEDADDFLELGNAEDDGLTN